MKLFGIAVLAVLLTVLLQMVFDFSDAILAILIVIVWPMVVIGSFLWDWFVPFGKVFLRDEDVVLALRCNVWQNIYEIRREIENRLKLRFPYKVCVWQLMRHLEKLVSDRVAEGRQVKIFVNFKTTERQYRQKW